MLVRIRGERFEGFFRGLVGYSRLEGVTPLPYSVWGDFRAPVDGFLVELCEGLKLVQLESGCSRQT